MNLTPLNEALLALIEARRAEKAAWRTYETANAAKQAADELLAQAKARLAREIDVMIEATA